MPYKGSYIWKIRQKIGHDDLIIPSADVIAVDADGKLLLVFNRDWNSWVIPGGYVEIGQTAQECAARELLEEAGVRTEVNDLVPIASISGHKAEYPNGDITWPHTQIFMTETWEKVTDVIDESEVADVKLMTVDEIKQICRDPYLLQVVDCYCRFRESGAYQIVNMREGGVKRP